MKKIKSILMFLVLTFSMSFCSKNVDVISMQEFQNNILNDKSIVLDVRTEEEYFGPLGHINGAISVSYTHLTLPTIYSV